jgi:muramoyltetrapeptide carboxypeptidase
MSTRREINKLLLGGFFSLVAQQSWSKAPEADRQSRSTRVGTRTRARMRVRPPRLRTGDAIALLNPGGWVSDEFIERSVRNAEALGLKPRIAKNLRARYGGYAGTPEERIEDLHTMWRDPEVKALWSVRGGSGTSQVLPFIDYAMIARNPKILMGFSDMTAMLNAVTHRSNIVTFHTPSGISTLSDYSKNHLQSVLFDGVSNYTMHTAAANDERAASEPEYRARTLREGIATGELIGGNLAVFSAMIGTPYLPSLAGKLLFLEDVNEAPYRIDRMLTQVRQHAGNAFPAGTLFGVCRKCEATDGEPSLMLSDVLQNHANAQPIPAVAGYSFGHIAHQMTLPIGARATLDTKQQMLTLLDAAVK